jgi:hypothetical protein
VLTPGRCGRPRQESRQQSVPQRQSREAPGYPTDGETREARCRQAGLKYALAVNSQILEVARNTVTGPLANMNAAPARLDTVLGCDPVGKCVMAQAQGCRG